MRRQCGWMELTCVETPNTVFRRAREISEIAFRRRTEKEKDSRENVETLSPWCYLVTRYDE